MAEYCGSAYTTLTAGWARQLTRVDFVECSECSEAVAGEEQNPRGKLRKRIPDFLANDIHLGMMLLSLFIKAIELALCLGSEG